MKLVCLLVAAVAFVQTASAPSRSLEDDFKDILQLIPFDKIHWITVYHLFYDREFQAAYWYVHSQEWKTIVDDLRAEPLVIELVEYLKETEVDVDGYAFGKKFDFEDTKVDLQFKYPVRSFARYLSAVEKVIPFEEIFQLVLEKLETSPSFQEFVGKVTSEYFFDLWSQIGELPTYQKFAEELADMGVDLNYAFKLARAYFSLNKKVE